uniref:Uncharacterized protein n=1 Tax=Sphaerodactylus townsendi TaxID=933632 RepID=A0ACB8FD90_9SAUR
MTLCKHTQAWYCNSQIKSLWCVIFIPFRRCTESGISFKLVFPNVSVDVRFILLLKPEFQAMWRKFPQGKHESLKLCAKKPPEVSDRKKSNIWKSTGLLLGSFK